jgi:hypothetical protein
MVEYAAGHPPRADWDRLRALQLAAVAVGSALIVAGLFALRQHQHIAAPTVGSKSEPRAYAYPKPHEPHAATKRPARAKPKPPSVRAERSPAGRERALAERASLGLARGLFTLSPGGAVQTAARVAQWRPQIVRAARGSGFDPNVLEGMVFLESAGRPNVIAGGDPAAASGLTQIVASTGAGFLHMRVHLGASRELTRRIWLASLQGRRHRVRVLEARRRRVDQRFAPYKALRGTVRYLTAARRYLGRNDLAVASYHMGIGNLQEVVRRWALAPHDTPTTQIVRKYRLSYAKLYFRSAPDRHASAWARLENLNDDTRDYYWKVLAAKRLMWQYRHDRGALYFQARQQARKNSAEEVLHPRAVTHRFRSPSDLARAWRSGRLRQIPRGHHLVLGASFGQMAHRLGRSKRLYCALDPDALAVLLYIGRRVHEISHARRPLIVTSAVRDERYQRVLMRRNSMAARFYSMHTTGYAFDIARSYGSRRQADAFQFVLERLQTLNLIAYIKEPGAIHIAVSSNAARARALLRRDA